MISEIKTRGKERRKRRRSRRGRRKRRKGEGGVIEVGLTFA